MGEMAVLKATLEILCVVGSLVVCLNSLNTCRFETCYERDTGRATPCVPFTSFMSLTRNVTTSNTCGTTRAKYCELPGPEPCYYCDANSSNSNEHHPVTNLVDNELVLPFYAQKYTWWQSQTWWETNQLGLSSIENPPKVNITLSFGKRYQLSGHIKATFYSKRPKAMCFDKSNDFGHTWETLLCYAWRCDRFYNMEPQSNPDPANPFKLYCTEEYSGHEPRKLGIVEFIASKRYEICDYFNPEVQDYLSVTDVRLRLEYPASDGMELLYQDEQTLNKLYYAISNVEVTGRCSCHGHAMGCSGPIMSRRCECEHNTMGTDCEMCKPLFNNRPWMRANQTHGNECQECNCNNHATSCVYNETLGYGLCKGCQHNTQGDHCQNCTAKHYRDLSKPINHVNACLACDCFPQGITNNGSCLTQATDTEQIGQCSCKPNVYGRRCDQCIPGHWGFTLPPQGECKACNCNISGTRNATINCDQLTGQCFCKPSIQGVYCDGCRDGFHTFPTQGDGGCAPCQCDLGGGFSICDKSSGSCTCRKGVEGFSCKQALHGTFYPALDYLLHEAETTGISATTITPATGFGSEFTGHGYSQLVSGRPFVFHNIQVPVEHQYYLVLRYTTSSHCNDAQGARVSLTVDGLVPKLQTPFTSVNLGTGQAMVVLLPGSLIPGKSYNVTVTYLGNNECQFGLDSLVMVPDVNSTRVFQLSGPGTPGVLQDCVNSRIAMSRINTENPQCRALVFSASTELYNGTKVCECDPEGSTNPTQCVAYGGQCPCKPGVAGLKCNHCLPGYYALSRSGCKKCECSMSGSITPICDNADGKCQCKANVEGAKCDACKYGTFHLDSGNPHGCQHCFGYGHAHNCTSASGFIATNITSNFITGSDGWTVVDYSGIPVANVTSLPGNGLLVTPLVSSHELFLVAPQKFLGNQLYSYRQKLHVSMEVLNSAMRARRSIQPDASKMTAILLSGNRNVTLQADVTTGHVTLDETHMVTPSLTPYQFQSLLTNLSGLWIRALYHPHPDGSVRFQGVSLGSAKARGGGEVAGFVERAECHRNYTGLSCEVCAEGYTRQPMGGTPFDRCVLCSCNDRSRFCHPETGVCTDCKIGTHGYRCELCTNNVQGPECVRCKPQYWGLSKDGCKACDCNLPGTLYSNTSVCDQTTGQCSCNATLHIGGQLCDRCEENAYNKSDSLFDCHECPSCYAYIQTDVRQIRTVVARLQALTYTIHSSPVIQSNKPFALRLNESIDEVSALVNKSSRAAATERDLDRALAVLAGDISRVFNRTRDTLRVQVNNSLEVGVRVAADHDMLREHVTKVAAHVRSGYSTLHDSVRAKINRLLQHVNNLEQQSTEIANLTSTAHDHVNRTLRANVTIQERALAAISKAAEASISASAVQTAAADLHAWLPAFLANVTRTVELGNRTLSMGEARLRNALDVLREAENVTLLASQPIPDNSKALNEVKSHTSKVLSEIAAYSAQASTLFNSSLLAIARVHAAVRSARELDARVRGLVRNATETRSLLLRAAAGVDVAIANASEIHREANKVLGLLQDFSGAASEAQARANQSLIRAREVEILSQQCINNVSAVNQSTHAAVLLARDAAGHGEEVTKLARQEQEVINETHIRARNLIAQTKSAEDLIANQTVRDFIRRKIEPVQDTCQNLSRAAHVAANQANASLAQAQNANTTAHEQRMRVGQLLNQSSNLPQITENRVPELNRLLRETRDLYAAQSASSPLAELREQVREQRVMAAEYKGRIERLRNEIRAVRRLVHSLGQAVATCGD
ncbi:laminin subunit beta-2 isoform X1 [Nematostella vectensis]|uniref:laminin subunit beta-2 isoform X1 n=2 Tax=Nematostella vectensis TaxID=45351 RepID=UPI002076EE31|nr:laminin subunit beta-2 isoform X1 [Nematostella vectensis]XP_048586844.1 laminin subunit beta-2 isoform X1 [Nematostella vectensis]XP_048586845.1 laminin subunit beta-2 isoform X1 [Nematostella vectensis]